MDFEEAKRILIDGYEKSEFKIIDVHLDQIYLEYNDIKYIIVKEEINDFLDFYEVNLGCKIAPTECSMCCNTYHEQLLDPLDVNWGYIWRERDKVITFGHQTSIKSFVQIGLATSRFLNFFRFDEKYIQYCKERLDERKLRRRRDVNSLINDFYYRLPTIRVNNLNKNSIEDALIESEKIINACLFNLSFLNHYTFALRNEWPIRANREKRFIFEFNKIEPKDQFKLPYGHYNPDIIKFYQHGMSSDFPVLQFLAFYHILEYFFNIVSDENLYFQLRFLLNHPNFYPDENNLEKLIHEVIKYRDVEKDVKLLKRVLTKFVNISALEKFILSYEHSFGKHYTKKRELFGGNVQISLDEDHIIPNIAKTIIIVRNALVHSSDRYKRNPRYIPFSESKDIVKKEIPLIKFLAEQVIIGSASLI